MTDVKRRWILLAIAVVLAAAGIGCPPPDPEPVPVRPELGMGRADAGEYLQQKLRLYRLVIRLQAMDRSGQEAYVEGVRNAFVATGQETRGEQVGKALLQAARGPDFKAAMDQGKRHYAKDVTNARVQSLIRGSLNRGLGVELGWKAGYIEGFRSALARESPGIGIEKQYDEAQAVYDALRSSL